MRSQLIQDLFLSLPEIFRQIPHAAFDDEWIVVGSNQLLPENDPIEESLFSDDSINSDDPINRTNTSAIPLEEVLEDINRRSPLDTRVPVQRDTSAKSPYNGEGLDRLPGALQRPDPKTKYVPPPDCYGFYLPWHYFDRKIWGIYLLVEGIEAYAEDLDAIVSPHLSRAQTRQVAKAFLFHHEAYHNAVETFAVRLEVTHRKPVYKTGFEEIFCTGFGGREYHEEGLACAYAALKTRAGVFSDLPAGRARQEKREIAYWALLRLISLTAPHYACGVDILKTGFDAAQGEFQEAGHAASELMTPPLPPKIWMSSLYSMGPSLQRNKAFSYIVRRSHPGLRLPLDARYLSVSRRDFIRKLRKRFGGGEEAGGRHPHFRAANGKAVPVPTGRELSEYTAATILKQLGSPMRVRDFLQG